MWNLLILSPKTSFFVVYMIRKAIWRNTKCCIERTTWTHKQHVSILLLIHKILFCLLLRNFDLDLCFLSWNLLGKHLSILLQLLSIPLSLLGLTLFLSVKKISAYEARNYHFKNKETMNQSTATNLSVICFSCRSCLIFVISGIAFRVCSVTFRL